MKFLHYDMQLGEEDVVEITMDSRANACLLDDKNFELYKNGEQFEYRGGFAKVSPFSLRAPWSGHWHLVVDLGDREGEVTTSVRITKNSNETIETEMNYLHYDLTLNSDDIVEVTLNKAANVCLLDDKNFEKYKRDEQFEYHGGHVKLSPYRFEPPKEGHWHLVIDAGNLSGSLRSSVKVIKGT